MTMPVVGWAKVMLGMQVSVKMTTMKKEGEEEEEAMGLLYSQREHYRRRGG